MSRLPVHHNDDHPNGCALDCIRVNDSSDVQMEYELSAVTANNINNLRADTWELIREHTLRDSELIDLMCLIKSGFPEQKSALSSQLDVFWNQREDLLIIDDVILMQHRAIIPKSLRFRFCTLPIKARQQWGTVQRKQYIGPASTTT